MKKLVAIVLLTIPFIYAIGQSCNTHVPIEAQLELKLDLKQGITTNEIPQIDGILAVKNIGKQAVKVQNLKDQMAVAFLVLNYQGNVVQPIGIAKVDGGFQRKVLEPNSEFKEEFEGLRFITGSGEFGYELKKGELYRVVAIFRPNGPDGVGVCSKETKIELR